MEKQTVKNVKRTVRDIENTLMFSILIKLSEEKKMIEKWKYLQS